MQQWFNTFNSVQLYCIHLEVTNSTLIVTMTQQRVYRYTTESLLLWLTKHQIKVSIEKLGGRAMSLVSVFMITMDELIFTVHRISGQLKGGGVKLCGSGTATDKLYSCSPRQPNSFTQQPYNTEFPVEQQESERLVLSTVVSPQVPFLICKSPYVKKKCI